jgi:hypothetical protein
MTNLPFRWSHNVIKSIGEVSDAWWKIGDWLVETCSKVKTSEIRWKSCDWLVEKVAEEKVCDGSWEVVDGLVETVAECKVSEVRG